ncbi:hypothetical protein CQW23_02228 [Capsicum baccatum]|uniref:Inosine/uridine-preferring nucleoside hydrolase domain-containing protein n=1 Tax=Capsicum baccatum TaxID=33114 RepID=A0A2G2XQU0_CAPBA|nr:hypothetical protein CQW23_02228 [Capsicum baccatum]
MNQDGRGRCQIDPSCPTGWANAATIDCMYDLLHMMGRDDIPMDRGDGFSVNQSDTIFSTVGDCRYSKVIPQDTTRENSAEFGAPQNTGHPEVRQPRALEVLESLVKSLDPGYKISILTNGPLTNVAKLILEGKNTSKVKQASGSSILVVFVEGIKTQYSSVKNQL